MTDRSEKTDVEAQVDEHRKAIDSFEGQLSEGVKSRHTGYVRLTAHYKSGKVWKYQLATDDSVETLTTAAKRCPP